SLTLCGRPELLQQCCCWPAVDFELIGALVQSNLPARIRTYFAVDLVDGIARRFQSALYLFDVLGWQLRNVLPRRFEVAATRDAISQMADEHGVKVGHVVAANDPIVLKNQKGRAVSAAGHHQVSLSVAHAGGKLTTKSPPHAQRHPL